ncbi:hypothetical protein [Vibrio sp. SCSIO 43137]|uniref:hypothetical protein n=1 Tax=Vibrio sp. SCSIO 43137 TaxID=3021011 RepID=UPI00230740E6|nr:hypothetical protein [Vibrio sp. SCSIO 43137]WCE32216.1 hypothetical protein PK654_17105 [Vibrio sp. SCSIO 43137]
MTEDKKLSLTAVIENKKFFSYRITEFRFETPDLRVDIDMNTGQLEPVNTQLIVSTDIPSIFDAGYKITPSFVGGECVDHDGKFTSAVYPKYVLGDQKLDSGVEVKFTDFSKDKNHLWVKKNFLVTFNHRANLNKDKKCSGAIALTIGLDF